MNPHIVIHHTIILSHTPLFLENRPRQQFQSKLQVNKTSTISNFETAKLIVVFKAWVEIALAAIIFALGAYKISLIGLHFSVGAYFRLGLTSRFSLGNTQHLLNNLLLLVILKMCCLCKRVRKMYFLWFKFKKCFNICRLVLWSLELFINFFSSTILI